MTLSDLIQNQKEVAEEVFPIEVQRFLLKCQQEIINHIANMVQDIQAKELQKKIDSQEVTISGAEKTLTDLAQLSDDTIRMATASTTLATECELFKGIFKKLVVIAMDESSTKENMAEYILQENLRFEKKTEN